MNKYTKEDCIEAIQSFYQEQDKIPRQRDFDNTNGKYPSRGTVIKHFNGWSNAIIASGFVTKRINSKDTVIIAIKKFYIENGRNPKLRDFINNPKYPSNTTVLRYFDKWNNALIAAGLTPENIQGSIYRDTTKTGIIAAIQRFYKENNRIPQARDFTKNPKYPHYSTAQELFGTWNAAIKAAGLRPNIQNGYGIDTKGLDKQLYRSQAEAYFCDKFLYQVYNYQIETKYPGHNKFYDWYLPDANLYIELDGGIRPKVIEEKKLINKQLNRLCLYIPTTEIRKTTYENLENFLCFKG